MVQSARQLVVLHSLQIVMPRRVQTIIDHYICLCPLTDESVLMDLKALLVEAKQKVPPVLQVLQTGDETMLDIGGEFFTAVVVQICDELASCSLLIEL